MEILRVAENIAPDGIAVTITVPGDHDEGEHILSIIDLSDLSVSTSSVDAAGGEQLTFYLESKYDSDYTVELIFDNDVLFTETYELRRPYSDPYQNASGKTEIDNYIKNEELARAIIDSVVPEGFYYKKSTIETVGTGSDYFPVWKDVKKILAVYENNELVTDYSFELTRDKSAIVQSYTGRLNRDESAPLIIPVAMSDAVDYAYPPLRGFPKTFDYRFVVEHGYKVVPSDIVRATQLLIDDISCGKLDYYKRYISDYNTDQFKIKFDSKVFEGTGNVIVDKILSKYEKSIKFIGVL